uniref:(northern house mosquito) hypothetical protein n=1 Tax=Culex pipiens TaxID=7175 RepID=A0A8D8C480_CULPI
MLRPGVLPVVCDGRTAHRPCPHGPQGQQGRAIAGQQGQARRMSGLLQAIQRRSCTVEASNAQLQTAQPSMFRLRVEGPGRGGPHHSRTVPPERETLRVC